MLSRTIPATLILTTIQQTGKYVNNYLKSVAGAGAVGLARPSYQVVLEQRSIPMCRSSLAEKLPMVILSR